MFKYPDINSIIEKIGELKDPSYSIIMMIIFLNLYYTTKKSKSNESINHIVCLIGNIVFSILVIIGILLVYESFVPEGLTIYLVGMVLSLIFKRYGEEL